MARMTFPRCVLSVCSLVSLYIHDLLFDRCMPSTLTLSRILVNVSVCSNRCHHSVWGSPILRCDPAILHNSQTDHGNFAGHIDRGDLLVCIRNARMLGPALSISVRTAPRRYDVRRVLWQRSPIEPDVHRPRAVVPRSGSMCCFLCGRNSCREVRGAHRVIVTSSIIPIRTNPYLIRVRLLRADRCMPPTAQMSTTGNYDFGRSLRQCKLGAIAEEVLKPDEKGTGRDPDQPTVSELLSQYEVLQSILSVSKSHRIITVALTKTKREDGGTKWWWGYHLAMRQVDEKQLKNSDPRECEILYVTEIHIHALDDKPLITHQHSPKPAFDAGGLR